MLSSILILVAGYRHYRFKKPLGSAFTRFFQVVVAAVRNHRSGVQEVGEGDRLYEMEGKESAILGARKIGHTAQYRLEFLFLRKMRTYVALVFLFFLSWVFMKHNRRDRVLVLHM